MGKLTASGGPLTTQLFSLDFQGTQLDMLYRHFEAFWWLPRGHMGPTWDHIAQAQPLSLVHSKTSCFSGRGVQVRRRVDWYCGYAAMNSYWCSCAAHVSPGQSFDINVSISLYERSEMGLQSVTPSSSITPPSQTSPSLKPALLTSITRNTRHQKSRTMIQIFYSLVEDPVANCWEPYQLSLSLMQPTCVKMKALIGCFALKWR